MTTPSIVRYSFPTSIFFGTGASKLLSQKLKEKNLRRPLLVTDKGLAPLPVVQNLITQLKGSGLSVNVFSDIVGNPIKSQVSAGVLAFRQHDSDSIIAVGGGAATDVAKAIGLMATHPGDLFDYEDGKADARAFQSSIPFLVALPTTSGTGSEVGRSSVISDDETKVKKIIFDPILLPQLVLADPELTLNLPKSITASTGMDALSHLLESFIAKGEHPICDGIALEGIYWVARSLVKCVKDPDLISRGHMMNAAMMGAIAFQKGLGVTHSCAHALSTVCDLHHGLANGIMLPYAMAFNQSAVSDKLLRAACTVSPDFTCAGDLIQWLKDLQKAIEIPQKLSMVGVKASHLPDLVHYALQDGCHLSNPKPVTQQDFEAIFNEAL